MRLPGSLLFVATLLVAGVRGDCDEDNLAYSTNDVERQKYNAGRTIRLGWVNNILPASDQSTANLVQVTFEGYAPLDLWGPLQILTGVCSSVIDESELQMKLTESQVSAKYNMTLSIVSDKKGPVSNVSFRNNSLPLSAYLTCKSIHSEMRRTKTKTDI